MTTTIEKREDGCVHVPVGPGKYSVLMTDIEGHTLAVVMPHPPQEPDLAASIAAELASIHKMIFKWADYPNESWAVNVTGEFVELYVPPAPGEEAGTVMGLSEEEAVSLIQTLADALAVLRAERTLGK